MDLLRHAPSLAKPHIYLTEVNNVKRYVYVCRHNENYMSFYGDTPEEAYNKWKEYYVNPENLNYA